MNSSLMVVNLLILQLAGLLCFCVYHHAALKQISIALLNREVLQAI